MNNLDSFTKVGVTVLISTSILLSSAAQAAPGNLPKAPLFLTDAVEPNIFFTVDDSGSMEWELMVSSSTGLNTSSALPFLGQLYRYYVIPNNANGYDGYYTHPRYTYTVPSTSIDARVWIAKNHIGNTLYYNPSTVYQPWPGGSFTDANPGSALVDPNNPGFGTIDLTSTINFEVYSNGFKTDSIFPATYFEWIDTDNDGVLETTDSSKRIEIKPANAPFPSGRSYADEIQNFANWFQYHRKRSYVAKAALGRVVDNTDSTRMGLDIFNGGHQEDAESMSDPSNKKDMFEEVYELGIYCGPGKNSIYPSTCRGTPARRALDRVGRLFEGATSDPTPILSASKGGECQQNFNVLLSDGFWNGSTPSGIGDADSDNNTKFDGNSSQSNDGGNYADGHSVTLADVAMHYYEND